MAVHAHQSTPASIPAEGMNSAGNFDVKTLMHNMLGAQQTTEQETEPTTEFESRAPVPESEYSPLEAMERELEDEETEVGPATVGARNPKTTELSKTADSPLTGDIETVRVKSEDGRHQQLKIDYTDRNAIKQAHLKAAGMRKFQAERDIVQKSLTDIQGKHQELSNDFEKLETAWTKGGVKGLATLLGGGEEAWHKAVDEEVQRREYMANLTPHEKRAMDLDNARAKEVTRSSELEQKYQALLQKTEQEQEKAVHASLESRLHPSFDRYRVAGKLSDPVLEHQLDQAIWTQSMQRLNEYPEHVELTQALIDKEFRTVAGNFNKLINQQTEKKVKTVLDNKKADASQRAQITAKKGLSVDSDKRKFVEDMKSGNIRDAFAAMFTGKVQL